MLASPLTLIMSPSNEESKEDFPDPTIPTMATKDPWGTCQVTFRIVESCNCWFGLSCQENDAFLSSIGCFLLSSWSIWKKEKKRLLDGQKLKSFSAWSKLQFVLLRFFIPSTLRKNKNLIWVKLPWQRKSWLIKLLGGKRQLPLSITDPPPLIFIAKHTRARKKNHLIWGARMYY